MIEKYSVCALGSVKLSVKGIFDGDSDILYFQHPLTGQWCESPEQTLQGWSEQDDSINALIQEINDDDMLAQKVCDGIEVITYDYILGKF